MPRAGFAVCVPLLLLAGNSGTHAVPLALQINRLPPKDFQCQTRVNGNSRSPHCEVVLWKCSCLYRREQI